MFPLLNTNPNIWAFVQQTTKEIENMNLGNHGHMNLSQAQKQAIKSLQNNSDIIIKPADKGGNLVIMNVDKMKPCVKIFLQIKNGTNLFLKQYWKISEYHAFFIIFLIIFKAY